MTLDAAISKLSVASDCDCCEEDILAACIVLRDTTGRGRLHALRSMCTTWDVARQEQMKTSGRTAAWPPLMRSQAIMFAWPLRSANQNRPAKRNSAVIQITRLQILRGTMHPNTAKCFNIAVLQKTRLPAPAVQVQSSWIKWSSAVIQIS